MAPDDTIGDLVDTVADAAGGTNALLSAAESVTFHQLKNLSDRRALQFSSLGVSKGTRFGLLLPNSVEWLASAFAASKLGAILVPLNTLWQRPELEHALRFADVQVLLTTRGFLKHDYVALLRQICPDLEAMTAARPLLTQALAALRHVVLCESPAPHWAIALDTLPPQGERAWLAAMQATVSAEDSAAIFFTSGTTATPKGAVHTHRSILSAARNVADRLGLDAGDRTWGYLPFFFTGGFVAVALATLSRAGAVLLQESFDAGDAIELMRRHGASTFYGWPHQAEAIANHPDFSPARLRLRKGPGAQAAWASRIFIDEHQAVGTWGMTESGPMATCTRFDDSRAERAAAHGRAVPGLEMRVIDPETLAPVAEGEPGELLVRGPMLMEQYYKTARHECFTADGFFRTGDLAALDAKGLLHFIGRLKDVIKTAGVNVAAAEVEAVLAQHPAVRAAYVVGVPHPTRGENVAAFVVLEATSTCAADDLLSFCRQRLASYKVPRTIRIGRDDQVPILGSGKVDKARLRERLLRIGPTPNTGQSTSI